MVAKVLKKLSSNKNPVAKQLRTPKYKPKVIPNKKLYDRKKEYKPLI